MLKLYSQILFLFLSLFIFANSACLGNVNDDSVKITTVKKPTINSDDYARLKPGDYFPNIIIYDTLGKVVPLDSIFVDSKGVIFVTGSYTCPNFRTTSKQLNKMVASQINTYHVYFIYIQEAHPIKGSPYGKKHDNESLNERSSIFINQHKWLEERIFYSKKAIKDFKITANCVIDNENNDFFWKVYAGPNGFLLFGPDKKFIRYELWYNQPNKKSKKEKEK